MIRLCIAASAIVLAAGLASQPAQAQQQGDPYPWCAQYAGSGLGGSSNCYFLTLEQCRATVSGVGGYCNHNPFYTGPGPAPGPRRGRPLPAPRIFQ